MKIYKVIFDTSVITVAANTEDEVKETLILFDEDGVFRRIDGKLLYKEEECSIEEVPLNESKILEWTTY
jgi:hypothetical protein